MLVKRTKKGICFVQARWAIFCTAIYWLMLHVSVYTQCSTTKISIQYSQRSFFQVQNATDNEHDSTPSKLDILKACGKMKIPVFDSENQNRVAEQMAEAPTTNGVFPTPLVGGQQAWSNSNSNNSVSLPYNVMLQHHLLQAALVANICTTQFPSLHQQGALQQVCA